MEKATKTKLKKMCMPKRTNLSNHEVREEVVVANLSNHEVREEVVVANLSNHEVREEVVVVGDISPPVALDVPPTPKLMPLRHSRAL